MFIVRDNISSAMWCFNKKHNAINQAKLVLTDSILYYFDSVDEYIKEYGADDYENTIEGIESCDYEDDWVTIEELIPID